ncbi:MAG: hypothetical protein HY860_00130, partial [Chlamydiales bacterium]|nr:hypothetical protein [Chlamydiales bacterium]
MTICNESLKSTKQYDRLCPFSSKIVARNLLNKEGSSKKTYLISLDLTDSGLTYKPGDAVAIFPDNDTQDVSRIISLLSCNSNHQIIGKKTGDTQPIKEFLTKHANLHKATNKLTAFLEIPYDASYDVLQCLERSSKRIDPQHFCDLLLPMLPRFYSIASSQYNNPHLVDLVVVTFEYVHGGRLQRGMGSSFLCETAEINDTTIPLYIHTNETFMLPSHDANIILIGPGTGIAPFRAFLQERMFMDATGNNWLFFGERNACSDFYFESYWKELVNEKKLKLNTAFSRDQLQKRYVQHEMIDHAAEVYFWIQSGAFIYVCGDAK